MESVSARSNKITITVEKDGKTKTFVREFMIQQAVETTRQ
jgi:hypothetical protein